VAVSGSEDGTVQLWELHGGERPLAVRSQPDPQEHAAGGPRAPARDDRSHLAHDGPVLALSAGVLGGRTVVASSSEDGTVQVWELATGALAGAPMTGGVLGGHADALALAEVCGRTLLVSGGRDGAVLIRDATTGSQIGDPLWSHRLGVAAVAVQVLEGRLMVVSGGRNGTVRVWDVTLGAGDRIERLGIRQPVELGSDVAAVALVPGPTAIVGSSKGLLALRLAASLRRTGTSR
jgi:WD40 repeat protein